MPFLWQSASVAVQEPTQDPNSLPESRSEWLFGSLRPVSTVLDDSATSAHTIPAYASAQGIAFPDLGGAGEYYGDFGGGGGSSGDEGDDERKTAELNEQVPRMRKE